MSEITTGCSMTLRRDVTGFKPGTGVVTLKAGEAVRVDAMVASIPVDRYRVVLGRAWAEVDAADLETAAGQSSVEAGHE